MPIWQLLILFAIVNQNKLMNKLFWIKLLKWFKQDIVYLMFYLNIG